MARKIPETVSNEEFLKIFRATKKKHHKAAFLLGFFGCLRISEVVSLEKDHIDRGRRLIKIKDSKYGNDRNIPLPPECTKALSQIPIKCGVRALQIAIKKYGKKILDRDIHFHTLRHSGATYYLNKKKWSTRQVQQLLGHSKIQTTEIYTHVTPQDLIEKMWDE